MLRRATSTDIPPIRDLAHTIWWAHYPDIITPEQIEYMLEQMYSPAALERQMTEQGIVFWVVSKNDAPVGFAAVGDQGDGLYFLHKYYLDASQQGRGMGVAVFHELVEQYPNMREMRLTVNRQNYKSINFYFKIGFRIENCADFPIGNGFVMNDFVMVWRKPIGQVIPSL